MTAGAQVYQPQMNATQDKNEPYTNLVSFLEDKDFKKIYFPTSKKTKKYENLSANSKTSILIDNRGNKASDIINTIVLTAIGFSKEIKEEKESILDIIKNGILIKGESVFMEVIKNVNS